MAEYENTQYTDEMEFEVPKKSERNGKTFVEVYGEAAYPSYDRGCFCSFLYSAFCGGPGLQCEDRRPSL